ncbi:hypothetical protein T11_5553 [Trichinella zimbabwensis]|uniref:Uncharacterized protein n=1 Tax=Trichinella zimbabwensis TaxID=268475 RepID=A0A0V1HY14_9BILA|nr:hypothetical protein T11_5553 [Trichinella zimbabwensis]
MRRLEADCDRVTKMKKHKTEQFERRLKLKTGSNDAESRLRADGWLTVGLIDATRSWPLEPVNIIKLLYKSGTSLADRGDSFGLLPEMFLQNPIGGHAPVQQALTSLKNSRANDAVAHFSY